MSYARVEILNGPVVATRATLIRFLRPFQLVLKIRKFSFALRGILFSHQQGVWRGHRQLGLGG